MAKTRGTAMVIAEFCLKLAGFWPAFSPAEQRLRDATIVYSYFSLWHGIVVEFKDLYYSRENHTEFIYTVVNVITLTIVAVKVAAMYVHKDSFFVLLLHAERHFWKENYNPIERDIISKCWKTSNLFVGLLTFSVCFAVVGFTVQPLIANGGQNRTDRVHPFNLWIDEEWLYRTPYFEIVFLAQLLTVYQLGTCYITPDSSLCILNTHVAGQFRILQYRVTSLGTGKILRMHSTEFDTASPKYAEECYTAFKGCVRQHQRLIAYCNILEHVYSEIILAQVILFSGLMCLASYQLLVTSIPPTRQMICIFFLMASMCQLFMLAYSCDGISHESSIVGTAMYSAPWIRLPMDKFGKELRKDLTMMILKAQVPCCLTANGFFPISLETYTTVLGTAMSYFTLLRQSEMGESGDS